MGLCKGRGRVERRAGAKRLTVRVLIGVLEGFHFAMEEEIVDERVEGEADGAEDEDGEKVLFTVDARVKDSAMNNLLPTLLSHDLERLEEADDSARLPVAIGIAQVARCIPPQQQATCLLILPTQVFRSESSDTRDIARDVLLCVVVAL